MSFWVAGATLVGTIGSGLIGGNASQSAADTQAGASNYAANLQNQAFQTLQNNLQPYMQMGQGAMSRAAGMAGQLPQGYSSSFSYDPSKDPFYQFELQQGTGNILAHQASMGGGLGGGDTLKALMDYGQGLAGQSYQQEFNNWLAGNSQALGSQQQMFQQLYGLGGVGENAAAGVGTGALNTASNVGNLVTGAANAQGANQIAQGNIWGSTLQQAFSPQNMSALMGYMLGPSSSGIGGSSYNYGGDYLMQNPQSGVILPSLQ